MGNEDGSVEKIKQWAAPRQRKIAIGLIAVCCIMTAMCLLHYRIVTKGEYMTEWNDQVTGEVTDTVTMRQTFFAPSDKVTALSVKAATYTKVIRGGTLRLAVYDMQGQLIGEETYPSNTIRDNDWVALRLDENYSWQAGGQYVLEITAENCPQGNALCFWKGTNPTYQLSVNGQVQENDLLLAVNYKHPVRGYVISYYFVLTAGVLLAVFPLLPKPVPTGAEKGAEVGR